jgi:dihydropyrimidinase
MSILIQNGRIITHDRDLVSDLLIEGEKVAAIGEKLNPEGTEVLDASGKYVIPGGIDAHTHFDMPLGSISTSDDFGSGTRAAAFGGTTCIIDYATQSRGMKISQALEAWLVKGEKAAVDFGLHMIVTDLAEKRSSDLTALIDYGVTSFKLFMAYPRSLMVDDATFFRVMRHASRIGGLVCVHAENGPVIGQMVTAALAEGKTAPLYHALTRPPAAESEAVHRAIAIAGMAGAPVYIVHVSSAEALEQISIGRSKGLSVYAETCPHYLLLSVENLAKPDFEGAKYVLSPPLREKRDQESLWQGLVQNGIDVLATDHCSFNFAGQKEKGRGDFSKIPNGGPGVETRLQLAYHFGVRQGRISLNRWVEICSAAPARIFGLYPRKGTLAPGSDADIVIWDPGRESIVSAKTHHMRVDYSMYEGIKVSGCADTVLSRGKVIVDRGHWLGNEGWGRFVRRDPFLVGSGCRRPE